MEETMNNDKLDNFIKKAKENKESFRYKISQFDEIFKGKKNDIVDLIVIDGMKIKRLYDGMIEDGILINEPYISFYNWIKKSIDHRKKCNKSITLNTSTKESHPVDTNKMKDSRALFYGFDMNKDLDEIGNILPIKPEIDHGKLCDCFVNDHVLTNEKIINILLCTVGVKEENRFKKTWMFLLLKASESIEEYYERLQLLANANDEFADEIFLATSCINRYALSSSFDKLKVIRKVK